MKKVYKIYALIHPVTREIRYIGLTKKNLEIRLAEHISSARSTKKKSNTYKKRWIQSILKDGLKPNIILIEGSLTANEVKDKEIYYIAKYRLEYKLVNLTDGGDGTVGFKLSKKSRKIIGSKNKIALTGRTLSDEHRKNIGLASQRPCTEAAKKKLRKKAKKQWSNPELLNKMKQRIGNNNPNYGGSKGAVCQLNSEGIITNEFDCLGDASSVLNIKQRSLRGAIAKNRVLNGYSYKFKKDI